VQSIVAIVLPTFATIIVGYIFGRWRGREVRALIDVAMYIALPSLAFTSMLDKRIVLAEAAVLWSAALVIVGAGFLMAFVLFRVSRQKHSGLYLPIVFMNNVNIPFPIVYMAFGPPGLAVAMLFYIPNALLIYSVGVHIASRSPSWKDSAKEVARVPLIYAAVGGLTLNLLHVGPPALLMDSLKFIGQAAIPLVLIVLGVNLSAVRLKQISTAVLASLLRIVGGLAVGLLVVALFHFQGVARSVVIFEAAMPSAVFGSMLCAKYDNESELVSTVVFLTTVASVITVPLLLYLLR
jgi:malate permease and related proteins